MSFLETLAAIVALIIFVFVAMIPFELISKLEEKYHEKKRK